MDFGNLTQNHSKTRKNAETPSISVTISKTLKSGEPINLVFTAKVSGRFFASVERADERLINERRKKVETENIAGYSSE